MRLKKYGALAGGLLVMLWAYGVLWTQRVNHDVSVLLEWSQRLWHGGRYGVDFIEPATPFTFMLYMPAVWLHEMGLSLPLALKLYIAVLFGGVVFLTLHVLRSSPRYRAFLLGVPLAFGMLFSYAMYEIPQKDLLAMVLGVPFMAAVYQTLQRDRIGRSPQTMAGLLVAFGSLVKAPITFIPLALWLLWKHPKSWVLWSAVISGLVMMVASGSLLLDWYRQMHLYQDVYATYFPGVLVSIYVLPGSLVLFFGLLWAFVWPWKDPQARAFKQGVMVVVLVFLGAIAFVMVQNRAWTYHLLPSYFLCFMMICALLYRLPQWSFLKRALVSLSVVMLGYVMLQMHVRGVMWESSNKDYPVYQTLQTVPAGSSWVLYSELIAGFPWQSYADVEWASRYPALWPVPWISLEEAKRPSLSRDGLEALEQMRSQTFENLLADLNRYKPGVVYISKSPLRSFHRDPNVARAYNTIEEFLRSDPSFWSAITTQYEMVEETPLMKRFVRRAL